MYALFHRKTLGKIQNFKNKKFRFVDKIFFSSISLHKIFSRADRTLRRNLSGGDAPEEEQRSGQLAGRIDTAVDDDRQGADRRCDRRLPTAFRSLDRRKSSRARPVSEYPRISARRSTHRRAVWPTPARTTSPPIARPALSRSYVRVCTIFFLLVLFFTYAIVVSIVDRSVHPSVYSISAARRSESEPRYMLCRLSRVSSPRAEQVHAIPPTILLSTVFRLSIFPFASEQSETFAFGGKTLSSWYFIFIRAFASGVYFEEIRRSYLLKVSFFFNDIYVFFVFVLLLIFFWFRDWLFISKELGTLIQPIISSSNSIYIVIIIFYLRVSVTAINFEGIRNICENFEKMFILYNIYFVNYWLPRILVSTSMNWRGRDFADFLW